MAEAASVTVLRSKSDVEKFIEHVEKTTFTKYIVKTCVKNFADVGKCFLIGKANVTCPFHCCNVSFC